MINALQGTGKFLEVMTNRLGLTQKELSQLASKGDGVTISSMCTVFAESEAISPDRKKELPGKILPMVWWNLLL